MIPLTPTELKILQLSDRGLSYKEIAAELEISVNTVKTHAHRILVKTAASCLANAAYLRGGKRV